MLHVVNLDLMHASARHHPDGQPKDPHEGHRRDLILQRRAARQEALRAGLHMFGQGLSGCLPSVRWWQSPHPSRDDKIIPDADA